MTSHYSRRANRTKLAARAIDKTHKNKSSQNRHSLSASILRKLSFLTRRCISRHGLPSLLSNDHDITAASLCKLDEVAPQAVDV